MIERGVAGRADRKEAAVGQQDRGANLNGGGLHQIDRGSSRAAPGIASDIEFLRVGVPVAVNGDDNKACVIDVFDFSRNGICTTVALLRYPSENDLSVRTIDSLFEDYSVFWDEIAADVFISADDTDLVLKF